MVFFMTRAAFRPMGIDTAVAITAKNEHEVVPVVPMEAIQGNVQATGRERSDGNLLPK